MKYEILAAGKLFELQDKVNDYLEKGYDLVGSPGFSVQPTTEHGTVSTWYQAVIKR